MKIAIAGAGAVGGVVAWHLARAGAAPTIVARATTVDAIAHYGLTLSGTNGPETVAINTTNAPAALGACDVVFTGFKAHDYPHALALVRPLFGAKTVVVPLLNGIPWWYFERQTGPFAGYRMQALDADGAIAAAIPAAAIIGGVVYMGASRVSPAHIAWNGRLRIVLGELDGGRSDRLGAIAKVMTQSGIETVISDDIRADVWLKLLGNTSYNPLSVATGATMGQLIGDPALKRILRLLMQETVAVAQAVGITKAFDIDARLAAVSSMRDFRTSMLQDFDAGRPMELGALVHAVTELGALTGIPTPTIETIGALAAARWQMVHAVA